MPSARVLFEWRSLDHVKLDRVLLEGRSRVRLLPRQLDRRRRRRQPARLGPQHLDGLQDRPHDRQGDLAARRQEERLRDGAGNAVRLAARRPPRRRRQRDDAVRQRRRPAGGAAVARARPRRSISTTKRATLVHQYVHRPQAARPRVRQRPDAAERERPRRLGRPSRTSPSTPRRVPCCSTRSCRTAARTTARSASRGARSRQSRLGSRHGRRRRGRCSTRPGTARPECTSWQVLAGPEPTSLTLAGTAKRTGFETRLHLTPGPSVRGSCRAGRRREAARPLGSVGPVSAPKNP